MASGATVNATCDGSTASAATSWSKTRDIISRAVLAGPIISILVACVVFLSMQLFAKRRCVGVLRACRPLEVPPRTLVYARVYSIFDALCWHIRRLGDRWRETT